MWTVCEEPDAVRALNKLPRHILTKYEAWVAIVRQSGPHGLRAIKSFHDEKLKGDRAHSRSSRLNDQWRVIYAVEATTVTVTVEEVTPHKY